MNSFLLNNNYVYVPGFISPEKAIELSQKFRDYDKELNLPSDIQVENSSTIYNFKPFLQLLCDKVEHVSSIVEESVLPTYCYARIYKNKSILKKHVDREACEVSVTVHLDGDIDWGIFIEKPDGTEKKLSLQKGDAMVYLGCNAPHWRDHFNGNYYSQVFLHYVISEGNNFEFYFDNNNGTIKNS